MLYVAETVIRNGGSSITFAQVKDVAVEMCRLMGLDPFANVRTKSKDVEIINYSTDLVKLDLTYSLDIAINGRAAPPYVVADGSSLVDVETWMLLARQAQLSIAGWRATMKVLMDEVT